MKLHESARMGEDQLKARLSMEAEIYIDGVLVNHVIQADEEAGTAEVWDQDRHPYGTKTLTGYVEIRDPRGEHVRTRFENRVGNGKGLTYRVLRSYVDECKQAGIDPYAEIKSVWGDQIEIIVVDTLPIEDD